MSPAPRETYWPTGEETDESYGAGKDQTEDDEGKRQGRVARQEQTHKCVQYMTRMEPRWNALPEVGMHCIVKLVGNVKQDVGQTAQASNQADSANDRD
jgi:hypothetical protein